MSGPDASVNLRDPAYWARLGETLLERHQMVDAVVALQRAVELDPTALNFANLGSALAGVDRLDESLGALQQAVALAPHWSEAHRGVGAALYSMGRVDEAIAAFERALAEDPANAAAHSMLLYMRLFQGTTAPLEIRAQHVAWAAMHTANVARLSAATNERSPDRRLRVGYVSPNFRNQAVARFVVPIFDNHDPWEVEIFAYSDAVATDATTAKLKVKADEWRETAALSDAQLANLVREDRIDLLVDLTGHIGGGRLRTFAAKPAPVQIAYLGYQATTGISAIDYVLTDDWADPPGKTEAFWVEQPWRLPGTFYCYDPPAAAPGVGALAAMCRGHVTFGCLNNLAKVTPRTLDVWSRILAAVADARLVLLAPRSDSVHERLRREFSRRNVSGDRIEFVGRSAMQQYLDRYNQIDIALDPIPFNGHTTTCDAAWMGVPTVCLAGEAYAYRYGGSVMRQCGLAELVVEDEGAYVAAAIGLARDLSRLSEIRASLRERIAGSVIMDGAGFVRGLEAAYRAMWRRWCASS